MEIKIYHQLCNEAKWIREEVFMKEQGFKNEFDDIDAISTHIVLFMENKPVGTCRIFTHDHNEYHLGRVAILKPYRGLKLGNVLLKEAEECARLQGGKTIVLSAQCKVEAFYAKNGYESVGTIYFDEHCEHIDMRKDITKPKNTIIAITTRTLNNEQKDRYITQESYCNALAKFDAKYISVTPNKDHDYSHIVAMCDGLLVSGGGDMDPSFYNEEIHPNSDLINPTLDAMDLALIDAFYKAKKPILGICRGFQVLNVYFKGSLYQDLPTQYTSEINHRQSAERHIGTHYINVCEDSFLGKKNTTHTVNTFHHQAIKQLGENLNVVAISEDGIVEAFEYDTIWATQWHPECMCEEAFHANIFKKFVARCKK